ncbi:MAG TPA: hypothetical protein VFS50_14435 [Meiothermus sp.]|nr:hypothetical protein [Meiothermus sp.]
MGQIKDVRELEDPAKLEFQRRQWRAQRVAWGILVVLVLAALLGLFGPGVLSGVETATGDGALRAEYHRFVRYEDPTRLELQVRPTGGEELRIWLSREYVQGSGIQQVVPQPESVEAGPDRYTYVFRLENPSGPVSISYELMPVRMGRLGGQVGLEGREAVQVGQFVYP